MKVEFLTTKRTLPQETTRNEPFRHKAARHGENANSKDTSTDKIHCTNCDKVHKGGAAACTVGKKPSTASAKTRNKAVQKGVK